jgi:hypothetical protein
MRNRKLWAGAGALMFVAATGAWAANQATVTDVQVSPKVQAGKGTHYLTVKFAVNVTEYVTSKKTLQLNATCKAGNRTLNTDSFTGVSVAGLAKGTRKEGSAVLFMRDAVLEPIDNCSMRFELHEFGRKYGDKPLNEFCYRGGKLADGACD